MMPYLNPSLPIHSNHFLANFKIPEKFKQFLKRDKLFTKKLMKKTTFFMFFINTYPVTACFAIKLPLQISALL